MRTISLHNGDSMPAMGLGTWQSHTNLDSILQQALQTGYRHLDCAAIYLNEKEIGTYLHEQMRQQHITRQSMWITSKLWNSFHDPKHVRQACVQTLTDLQLDYLDLYLMHWPVAQIASLGLAIATEGKQLLSLNDIPLAATYLAMQSLVKEGLVRHIGVANFGQQHLKQLQNDSGLVPSVNQIECHPFLTQDSLHHYCREQQIAVTAYSPLGAGARPDFMQDPTHPQLLEQPNVTRLAEALNATPAQVLLAWSMQQGRCVIPKSSNPQRIRENFAAQELILDTQQLQQLNQLNQNLRYVDGGFFVMQNSPYHLPQLWD